ncbi:hypothetical protein WJX72_000053 [[Myrmecia] bisecta]|uniref:DNA-directed RNA polymerase subunit n=1 Tax=[Myrmecia] bisecta TaxID=41462 RepID=A0AAW1Q6B4_9CHLO
MTAIPSREVTTTQVAAVSFGFYSDEEIRKLSVKQIVSPIVYDNLKNAVPGGLYDAAMGPMEPHDSCQSCGLRYQACPGHFGHVELAVPVYNPLVFGTLYKLLRCTCLQCFRLKMAENEVEKFRRKLELLFQGRLVEAAEIFIGGGQNVKKMVGKLDAEARTQAKELDNDVKDMDQWMAANGTTPAKQGLKPGFEAESVSRTGSKRAPQVRPGATAVRAGLETAHTVDAMRECVAELLRKMPTGVCANCKACNPNMRREGSSKIFQLPLPPKMLAKNQAQGVRLVSVLESAREGNDQVEAMERDTARQLESEAHGRQKRKRSAGEDGEDDMDLDDGLLPDEPLLEDVVAPSKATPADGRPRYMTPAEVREIMRRMWETNSDILSYLYAVETHSGPQNRRPLLKPPADAYRMFFLQTIAVAPNRFRPPSKLGDMVFEHPQNTVLAQIINYNLDLVSLSGHRAQPGKADDPNQATAVILDLGRSLQLWLNLQNSVNGLYDSSAAENGQGGAQGIRQQLEKKEGLFRKNMMGKRVNFAARSVISPDPYIGTGEIGVPPYFAKRLSFPERVTAWNVQELREMVVRGAHQHPGAVAVEDEFGRIISLAGLSAQRREAVAKQLLSGSTHHAPISGRKKTTPQMVMGGGGGKIVYRHLRDGDVMLTNRQPTLHKPGLMAHRARVLKGERTIRMHYANCATFNADFDGDEINLHLPQDHLGRAEGYNIVHSDEQYIVPTDGKPIRGLIQDHVVSGTLLTKRDTFLTRKEFMQLLYSAVAPARAGLPDDHDLEVPTPAILKPRPLWTGKQVISALVGFLTRGMPPLTLQSTGKVPAEYWGRTSGELDFVFHQGQLVSGCMDKAQYGKYGLVHAVQELYGNPMAGKLLSAFSRLFTSYLQFIGFTCGMDDLLLVSAAEKERARLIGQAESVALAASADFVGESGSINLEDEGAATDEAFIARERGVRQALSRRYRSNKDTGVAHDMKTTAVMHPLSSDVIKVCLPGGQVKAFPGNCLSLMTVSGAKGSLVNFSQISCLLGQQELEGRRVPRMSSGKTLPCFSPFDAGARSGGFIGDRFLSGLRPQEYYFHCMAGRDGLVDTTVKTSRSGYLQRCLVKNLESLRVHYDCTVRDDSDGSIVQFQYGEDGIDVMNIGYLKQFGFLAQNAERFAQQLDLDAAVQASQTAGLEAAEGKAREASSRRQKRLVKQAKRGKPVPELAATLPATALYGPTCLGVVPEAFGDELGQYVRSNPDGVLHMEPAASTKAKKSKKHPEQAHLDPRSPDGFQRLMELKFMRSLAAPGEAVGVIAAQSVGEPSTQMTLNTFHMAGRGEANVTLGIPRLRELFMTAAQSIKTPVMTMPLRPNCTNQDAHALANRLRRLKLAEVLANLTVEESPACAPSPATGHQHGRLYTLKLQCFPPSRYPPDVGLTFEHVTDAFHSAFMKKLTDAVKLELKKSKSSYGIHNISSANLRGEEGAPPLGTTNPEGDANRRAKRSEKDDEDENAEENEEYQEAKLRFKGGRAEQATYDAGDQEDRDLAAAARKQSEQRAGDLQDEDADEDEAAAGPSGQRGSAPGLPPKSPASAGQQLNSREVVDEHTYTCTAHVALSMDSPKLLMLELAEKVAAQTMVRHTEGIEKCYVIDADRGAPPKVQTDGINFVGAWQNSDVVDVDAITTNDVGAVLHTFGVEAARATLVREVRAVFGAYGIGVDVRHLSLIADFMMHQGGYRACNRMGIESSPSTFLKISFETAAHFLTDATMRGSTDDLASPASRLVLGRVVEVGTGCCDLIQNLGKGEL